MSINEEYAIEMLLSGHLHGKEIGEGYIVAFMYECNVTNPEKLDKWLLNNGFLREPTVKESLNRYTIPELKEFLSHKNMKISGKKIDLIERLLSALSQNEITALLSSDKRYFLSEKGMKHYNDNIDLEELHRNWIYNIELNEYFKHRKQFGGIIGYYETAYIILQKKITHGTIGTSITASDFINFSEVCEKLQMNEDALKFLLINLYVKVNLLDSYYLDKNYIESNGIKTLYDSLNETITFNLNSIKRIVNLSEYYSTTMVDDIYSTIKLQYILLDKVNFKSLVNDMIQSAYFDATPYMRTIKENYKRISSQILKGKNKINIGSILQFLHKI